MRRKNKLIIVRRAKAINIGGYNSLKIGCNSSSPIQIGFSEFHEMFTVNSPDIIQYNSIQGIYFSDKKVYIKGHATVNLMV
jgi:hypothetical protein